MTPEGLLAFFEAAGFHIHKSPSALWYEAGPRFWLASPSHDPIDPPDEELRAVMRETGALGLRYTSSKTSAGRESFIMTARGADYGLERLASNARSKIRRGLKRHEIRRISGAELKHAGQEAFTETLSRQDRAESYPLDKWHRLLDAADAEDGVEIWAAWFEDTLAAYHMVFLIDDTCEFYQGRSRNELLKHYPNNALVYFLTEEMLVRRGLREVTYGIESLEETKSVDSFKLSMGYERTPIHQRVVFHPAIDVCLRLPGIGRALTWIGTRDGAASYWRKAYGLAQLCGHGVAMTRPSALVFPDNPAALAVSRELGAAGVPVLLGHRNGDGPAAQSKYTTLLRMPDLYTDTSVWAKAMLRASEGLREPPVLFPTEDAALLAVERHYEELSAAFRLPYAAPGIADAIADKRRLYAAAEDCGVAVPGHREITEASQAGDLPDGWLVKPSCRYVLHEAGIRTFLATTGGPKAIGGDPVEAASRVLGAGFPAVAQEEIDGGFHELISIGLVIAPDGSLRDSFITRKDCEYPEPYGDGLIVELATDPGITEPALALLRSMGYWGICDIEFKRDARDGRFKLLDANPRSWLWMTLGTLTGHSLAVHAYNAVLDEDESAAVPVAANPAVRRWVSARGSAGFMRKVYKVRRHGVTLPARLAAGVAATAAANLKAFGDPLYVRTDAWRALWRTAVGHP